MRIIAGIAKGRRLKAVPGTNTRPTTDKVKESIFSMIGPFFEYEWVLDLFAGTGGLGIEALSRGVRRGIFIDKDSKSIETIKENLRSADFMNQAEVYRNDAERALKTLQKREIRFELVFLDPPYRIHTIPDLLLNLTSSNMLCDQAVVVCEHSSDITLPNDLLSLHIWKKATYGDTAVTIYRVTPSVKETEESES